MLLINCVIIMNKIYINKQNKQKLLDIIKNKNSNNIQLCKKYFAISKIVNELNLPKVICDMINEYVNDIINIDIKFINSKFNTPINERYEIQMTANNTLINFTELKFTYNFINFNHEKKCYLTDDRYKLGLCAVNNPFNQLKSEESHCLCMDDLTIENCICGSDDNITLFNIFMNYYYKKKSYINEGKWSTGFECYSKDNMLYLGTPHQKSFKITNKKSLKNIIVIMKVIIDAICKSQL
jgi:hypothetical protein